VPVCKKYECIKVNSSEFSVEKMCEILKVSRSGYYDWLERPECNRSIKDRIILKILQESHKKSPMAGLDSLWCDVKEVIPCCRGRVYRIMKENGIRSKRKPKWKQTTNSKHDFPVAPNLLNQNFDVKRPNTVWVGDITYNWTEEGWLYTAIVKDLCTKDIVGYAMSDHITKELAVKAMKMAIRLESPKPGLIFHSDRGSQYCSNDYQELLKRNGITPSMSRKGNPYDNAVAENFFSNMKCECTNFYNFKSRAEASQVIFEYIEVYYNRQRRHSGCSWLPPKKYKQLLLSEAA
jgi:putative transposase